MCSRKGWPQKRISYTTSTYNTGKPTLRNRYYQAKIRWLLTEVILCFVDGLEKGLNSGARNVKTHEALSTVFWGFLRVLTVRISPKQSENG